MSLDDAIHAIRSALSDGLDYVEPTLAFDIIQVIQKSETFSDLIDDYVAETNKNSEGYPLTKYDIFHSIHRALCGVGDDLSPGIVYAVMSTLEGDIHFMRKIDSLVVDEDELDSSHDSYEADESSDGTYTLSEGSYHSSDEMSKSEE